MCELSVDIISLKKVNIIFIVLLIISIVMIEASFFLAMGVIPLQDADMAPQVLLSKRRCVLYCSWCFWLLEQFCSGEHLSGESTTELRKEKGQLLLLII